MGRRICRDRLVRVLDHLLDDNQRREDILEEYDNDDHGNSYVLVETSTVSQYRYLTLWDRPEDAADYWAGQDNPDDWDPTVLIDLNTGAELQGWISYQVTWEPSVRVDPYVPEEVTS